MLHYVLGYAHYGSGAWCDVWQWAWPLGTPQYMRPRLFTDADYSIDSAYAIDGLEYV